MSSLPQLNNIFGQLKKKRLDALLLSSPANIVYITQFQASNAYLLISEKETAYFTDSRYTEAAKLSIKKGINIRKIDRSFSTIIADSCRKLKLKRIAFEERALTYAEYKKIKKELPKNAKLIPTHGIAESLRQIKTAQEVEEIKKGLTITISAFRFIKHYIIPGKKEIEVQAELERFIRYHGASNSAFETIVASGPNSSFPHHKAGERKLRMSEPVLIDFGVDYHGYKTDLTRVFFLGKITPAFRKIYNIVTRAHGLALRTIRPGVKISSIDKAARQYIKQSGYGGFFSHNLGHGVGREIHEEPHISEKEESLLKKGMVFTLEPAIYLPGKFGVRIEDMVLVREAGCEILSANLEK